MRLRTAIFPHPLDAWLRIFALSPVHGENPPGVAQILLFAARWPPVARAKYLTKHD
jgi:hypothetical protein